MDTTGMVTSRELAAIAGWFTLAMLVLSGLSAALGHITHRARARFGRHSEEGRHV